MPGLSGVRFEYPFARTDSGVSLKRKNSYSEAHFTENPSARAFWSIFCSTCRGETGTSKSSRNAAVCSSHGMRRKLPRSTVAWVSGYPLCQPVTCALSYSWSPLSHPKITSQNPRPPSATLQNLSSDTYLPRSTPSMSNPPSLTLRMSCLRNSSRRCSICFARALALSMEPERGGGGAARQDRPGYIVASMQARLSTPRLLVVQTGTTTLHGDYPRWFERALGFALPVVRAH